MNYYSRINLEIKSFTYGLSFLYFPRSSNKYFKINPSHKILKFDDKKIKNELDIYKTLLKSKSYEIGVFLSCVGTSKLLIDGLENILIQNDPKTLSIILPFILFTNGLDFINNKQ